MVNIDLKTSLIQFPLMDWETHISSLELTESQFMEAISDILGEYGKFPVTWNNSGTYNGLFVTGSNDSYVGHWMSNEESGDVFDAMSIASEDLGDIDMASQVIFRTYFSHYLASRSEPG
jgi:hypothetical protein